MRVCACVRVCVCASVCVDACVCEYACACTHACAMSECVNVFTSENAAIGSIDIKIRRSSASGA